MIIRRLLFALLAIPAILLTLATVPILIGYWVITGQPYKMPIDYVFDLLN